MTNQEQLAEQFEGQRTHLRAVAYRMLGSVAEADDAVQEAWMRLARADVSEVKNLQAWLTTVVSRVCLDLLRARKSRREESLEAHVLEAFLAAAREGDFDALVAVLDPDVTLRADTGSSGTSRVIRGAAAVAGQALMFAKLAPAGVPVLVNGSVGMLAVVEGRPTSVFSPVIRDGRIIEINIVADPDRLAGLDLRGVI
jgi:RNA polymerase sigma factor (sigma-70 family)